MCYSFVSRVVSFIILSSGAIALTSAFSAEPKDPQPSLPVIPPGAAYRQRNLVSDWPGLAPVQDPLLVNPWGISMTASSPFWVSNNATNTAGLYRGDVSGSPFVNNPSPPFVSLPSSGGLPTGTVANGTTDFVLPGACASAPCTARFLFARITGDIVGWNPNAPAAGSTQGVVAASNPGHVYTGLAIGVSAANNFLYAADFANGRIDVYDKNFVLQPAASFPFSDPTIPTTPGNTYYPHNIQNIGGSLYVAYAKVGAGGRPADGVGNGFVRRFNPAGVRDLTFGINNGPLNAPWGIVIAPSSFGIFGSALLVGNFGEGNPSIHAFNPTNGAFLGTLQDESGNGIVIDELWALTFGNGGAGGDPNTLYFTAGIGEEEHGLLGKLNPTVASATSLIQFSNSELSINEGSGHIDVTVTRSGDVSGLATVNYATFDESQVDHASQKADYELACGKLTFKPGESSKTFRILIVNDIFDENDEELDLYLSNPTGTGVGLGSPATARVEILDNDTGAPTTNPIDDPVFFVRQLFLDFLGREPGPVDLSFFVSQLTACGSDNTCRDTRRANVATAFFLSAEFQQSGFLVFLANKAAFGALSFNPNIPLFYGQLMRDLQNINQDVPFGTPGWEAILADNQQSFVADFILRPSFANAYLTTLTPAQFVDALYAKANVVPSSLERQAAIDEFGGAGDTANIAARARALRRVTQNTIFDANELNRAVVFSAFAGFLRRDPDFSTFNARLNTLNSFGGDLRASGLINTFLMSDEYRQRFGVLVLPPPGVGSPPTPAAQSLNISTRGRVATGDNVLIAGFIVTGSGSKNVVVRAIGPSLISFGISDGLPDPFLELRAADGSLIASNDDWRSNQAAVIATGLAPTDDRESAIVRTMSPGVYTAVVRGKGSATGVTLAEVYDIDAAPSTSQLANISTRGLVQTQNNVLIGGFQLGGDTHAPLILARAIGPSLADFAIASPLADPNIEFHDSNGVTVSENDNWRDTQELEVLYLNLAPNRDAESAVMIQPAPGAYTAIVKGSNGSVGVGLVEIFNFR